MHFFLLDLTATEISDVKNLQSQIDNLSQLGNELKNRPSMGPDTIMS